MLSLCHPFGMFFSNKVFQKKLEEEEKEEEKEEEQEEEQEEQEQEEEKRNKKNKKKKNKNKNKYKQKNNKNNKKTRRTKKRRTRTISLSLWNNLSDKLSSPPTSVSALRSLLSSFSKNRHALTFSFFFPFFSSKLINSFPLPYSSWSWAKEKLSIPLEAHDKAQSGEIFLSFRAKKEKSCIF